jgi:hypothetical protein
LVLKQLETTHKMAYVDVRWDFVRNHRARFGATPMCYASVVAGTFRVEEQAGVPRYRATHPRGPDWHEFRGKVILLDLLERVSGLAPDDLIRVRAEDYRAPTKPQKRF